MNLYGTKGQRRCYETHPPLPLVDGLKIYGGSCGYPVVDADIYVGFDHSHHRSEKSYPWEEGESFQFPITDMQAPKDLGQFKKLLNYLEENIRAGKKVHIGCIGGHGRTGTVLAALYYQMTGSDQAVAYVRKNYCQKAVESEEQVQFLMAHFGQQKVEPTKMSYFAPTRKSKTVWPPKYAGAGAPTRTVQKGVDPKTYTTKATKSPLSIWGDEVAFDKL